MRYILFLALFIILTACGSESARDCAEKLKSVETKLPEYDRIMQRTATHYRALQEEDWADPVVLDSLGKTKADTLEMFRLTIRQPFRLPLVMVKATRRDNDLALVSKTFPDGWSPAELRSDTMQYKTQRHDLNRLGWNKLKRIFSTFKAEDFAHHPATELGIKQTYMLLLEVFRKDKSGRLYVHRIMHESIKPGAFLTLCRELTPVAQMPLGKENQKMLAKVLEEGS